MERIANLLERSVAFDHFLSAALDGCTFVAQTHRTRAAIAAAQVSVEHARAVRVSFAAGLPNAACALSRVQYEALLRAAWALYVASDDKVAKLNAPLDVNAEQDAKSLPGALDMLKALKGLLASRTELVGLVAPLSEIHAYSWRAMNSFVHAGIHPLNRSAAGFPVQLADTILRGSNGMMHMAYRLLGRLQPQMDRTGMIDGAWRQFSDCCPMHPSASVDQSEDAA